MNAVILEWKNLITDAAINFYGVNRTYFQYNFINDQNKPITTESQQLAN